VDRYKDYDALDVNMGCPKHFSIQGGMGCGLLKNRQKIKEVKNVDWIDDK